MKQVNKILFNLALSPVVIPKYNSPFCLQFCYLDGKLRKKIQNDHQYNLRCLACMVWQDNGVETSLSRIYPKLP